MVEITREFRLERVREREGVREIVREPPPAVAHGGHYISHEGPIMGLCVLGFSMRERERGRERENR